MLMPMLMLCSLSAFWAVLSYRFAVMLFRWFIDAANSMLVFFYGEACGRFFVKAMTCCRIYYMRAESNTNNKKKPKTAHFYTWMRSVYAYTVKWFVDKLKTTVATLKVEEDRNKLTGKEIAANIAIVIFLPLVRRIQAMHECALLYLSLS